MMKSTPEPVTDAHLLGDEQNRDLIELNEELVTNRTTENPPLCENSHLHVLELRTACAFHKILFHTLNSVEQGIDESQLPPPIDWLIAAVLFCCS
jgi:hypothetical protein